MTITEPQQAPALRWGILGAGFIAGKFVNAVQKHTRSTVLAVGSRTREKAESFAQPHGIERPYGSYRHLVEDPEIDAIYVATPHVFHLEHALLALRAGKPVLIEKPLALSAAQGELIASEAESAGLFAMEAMWTRFLPHMTMLRQWIAEGRLGDLVHMHASHGQLFPFDPDHRLYARELGGGALLDLGVYPMSFVHDIMGEPTRLTALGTLTPTEVDGHAAVALDFEGPRMATVSTTSWALTGIDAMIAGTTARVRFDDPFLRPTVIRLADAGGEQLSFDGRVANGFQFEVAEAARCIAEGRQRSEVLPLEQSIGVLRSLDEARAQIGVRYEAAGER